MKTNIPMEQAFIDGRGSKRSPASTNQNRNIEKPQPRVEWGSDQGPMLTTSEILDFAEGTDSTP